MYQDEKDIEIIVINDGSTDGTKEFLESDFIKEDPRIRVIHHETSQGAGLSRNEGTLLAKSDIVAQMDDDDVALGNRVALTLEWFKGNPDSEMVNFPYVRISHLNDIMEQFHGEEFDESLFKDTGRVNYFSNPTVAYKKDVFLKTPGYGEESKEATDDYLLVSNWVKEGKKIDFCPGEPVTLHRVLKDSMMSQFRGFKPEWAAA
jgi:glycosyltransferase involved in cell wall biosynthesis